MVGLPLSQHARAFSEWEAAADRADDADRDLREVLAQNLFRDRLGFEALSARSKRLHAIANEKLDAAIAALDPIHEGPLRS